MVGRLVYLLDTNIILELLLDQDHADQVAAFLNQAAPESLHISEFSLYSLGVILLRLRRFDLFLRSVKDLFLSEVIGLLRLGVEDMAKVAKLPMPLASILMIPISMLPPKNSTLNY